MAGYYCTFKSFAKVNGFRAGGHYSPVIFLDCDSPERAAQEAAHRFNMAVYKHDRIAVMDKKTEEVTYWVAMAYIGYEVAEEKEATA
jgi:hypothetical protein